MPTPFQSSGRTVAVTTSDSVRLQSLAEALWIGVAGTISFIPNDPCLPPGSAAAISTNVPSGLFPVQVWRVNATGTSATGILALY